MNSTYNWRPIETAPDRTRVMTKIHDANGCRNEQIMKRDGRLWWLDGVDMYAYYTPTHWAPLS